MRLASRSPLFLPLWRPTVLAVMTYVAALAVIVIWVLCTVRVEAFSDAYLGDRFFGFSLHEVWTAANVLWLVMVLMELRPALRAPRALRFGQVCGVIAASLVLLVVQVLAQSMKSAAEAWM